MKAFITRDWLDLTSFDSSAPSGGATIVHRFAAPGEYRVAFVQDATTLAETLLLVGPEGADKTTASPSEHVRLDLSKLVYQTPPASLTAKRDIQVLRSDGCVSFTDSGRFRRFAIVIEATSGHRPTFDSRRLEPGNIFALTLIRPGEYRVRNEIAERDGTIVVAYPVVGPAPYRPPDSMPIDCDERGFHPASIHVKPAQGLIFRVQTPSRITIELTRPDDGPGDRGPRTVRLSREKLLEAMARHRESMKEQK